MSTLSTNAVEALYATGHWLLGNERFADAAKVFRIMAHNCPSDERGWLALGQCHEKIGQLAIACELYRLGIQVSTSPVRCAIALARALSALGREDDAAEALATARELALESSDDSLVMIASQEVE